MNEIVIGNVEAIKKAKLRFTQNCEGFFEAHKTAFPFLIIAAMLDAFSTFCFMYVLGGEYEYTSSSS